VNGDELAAAADLMDLIAGLLEGVHIAYYDDAQWEDSVGRLAAVRASVMALHADLVIDAEYPSLTDAPLNDLRKYAEKLRDRLAAT
jgi:hypothetical protein